MGSGRTITVSRWAYEKQLNKAMVSSHRVFFIALPVGDGSLPFEEKDNRKSQDGEWFPRCYP
jgi:hypothetical protein